MREKIMNELERQLKLVYERIPSVRVLGIFLRGSQNYGLANENSDVDSVALVFPSNEDFIFNRKPENYIIKDGEHNQIQVLDIRLFFHQLRKSSPSCLELLFTKYEIVEVPYWFSWNRIKEHREKIAYLNKNNLLKAYQGFIHTNMKQFLNVPDKRHKKAYQILRAWEIVTKILRNSSYEEALYCQTELTRMIKDKEISVDNSNAELIMDIGNMTKQKIDNMEELESVEDNILDKLQKEIILFYMGRVF